MLDAIVAPLILLKGDGWIKHMNREARSRLPDLALNGYPPWAGDRGGESFRLFLRRCLGSTQPMPGALKLKHDRRSTILRCWGARFVEDDEASVLLQVIPKIETGFASLNRTVEELQGELRARAEVTQRLADLLVERDRLVAQLESDSASRLQAERERDEVLVRLYRIHQQDRLRLARDLHDHANQHIVNLKLGLSNLRRKLAKGPEEAMLDNLLQQVDTAGQELRRVALELRPAALEEFGLPTALRGLVEDWGGASGTSVEFLVTGQTSPLPSEAEVTLFHLVQEALSNISKHATEARTVSVILQHHLTHVSLTVEDDGGGFDATQALSRTTLPGHGFGLVGMAERLALVRGMIEIDSRPGAGTTLFARIPVEGCRDDA